MYYQETTKTFPVSVPVADFPTLSEQLNSSISLEFGNDKVVCFPLVASFWYIGALCDLFTFLVYFHRRRRNCLPSCCFLCLQPTARQAMSLILSSTKTVPLFASSAGESEWFGAVCKCVFSQETFIEQGFTRSR